jgi:ribosomal protein S27AE
MVSSNAESNAEAINTITLCDSSDFDDDRPPCPNCGGNKIISKGKLQWQCSDCKKKYLKVHTGHKLRKVPTGMYEDGIKRMLDGEITKSQLAIKLGVSRRAITSYQMNHNLNTPTKKPILAFQLKLLQAQEAYIEDLRKMLRIET